MKSVSVSHNLKRREFDHDAWHEYLMGKSHNDKEKNEIIQFLMDHLFKCEGFLYYAHCFLFKRGDFCSHCSSLPKSTMLDFIHDQLNGFLPFPMSSNNGTSHFQTFFELVGQPVNARAMLR